MIGPGSDKNAQFSSQAIELGETDYNEENLHECKASRIACVYIPHRKALSSSFRIKD